MPLLQLDIASLAFTPGQGHALRQGLTRLMADLLHKRADLTVVNVAQRRPDTWAVGGQALPDAGWSASLQVFITAGTNEAGERARFISAAHALIQEVMQGPAATPLYIVLHEVPADSWGYDGLTQAARKLGRPVPPVMTLRQMAGMPAAQTPPPVHAALLLIDFQREYVDGALPLPDVAHAARQASQLVAAAERVGVPVIHVHHEAASALAPAFAPGSPGAQPMQELPVASRHHRIVKQWPSSFKGTPLHPHLQDLKVQHLVVAGLMTHNCVDSTAREALHLGYAVTVVRDACATRDLPDDQGGVITASQVHQVSLAALADRHADVLSASEVVGAWRA